MCNLKVLCSIVRLSKNGLKCMKFRVGQVDGGSMDYGMGMRRGCGSDPSKSSSDTVSTMVFAYSISNIS